MLNVIKLTLLFWISYVNINKNKNKKYTQKKKPQKIGKPFKLPAGYPTCLPPGYPSQNLPKRTDRWRLENQLKNHPSDRSSISYFKNRGGRFQTILVEALA